ncbi:MAG TPA: DegT/DnrJ/EryC1/StrS family aminotransferase, partial [Flavobacteriaceae bacterium]|nr:DegT/DnrJ/EryC1/StrS family aminotransferase [Flavobacteriaceae bacterium]
LQQNHIATLIHYPIPPHNQRALKEFNHLNFPVTEEIHHTVLSLPMSPVLEEKEVSYIIDTINRY